MLGFEIYSITCFLSCIFASIANRVKKTQAKILFWISIMPPFFVSSFRYNNGPDYLMYINMFESIRDLGFFYSIKEIEIGFIKLIELSLIFSDSPFVFFGFVSLFILFFYYKGIYRNSRFPVFSILLFFIAGIFFDTFNGLRQYIAASIVFWGFSFILDKKLGYYIVIVLFASLFHYTALISLPLYLFSKVRIKLPVVFCAVLFLVLGQDFIFKCIEYLLQYTRYSFYLDSDEFVVTPTISTILYTSLVSSISIVIYIKNKAKLTERFCILFNLSIVAWLVSLSSLSIPLSLRLQYYIVPILIIFIPELLIYISNKLIKLFFVILLLIY